MEISFAQLNNFRSCVESLLNALYYHKVQDMHLDTVNTASYLLYEFEQILDSEN